jgi:hypothetical protein
MSLSSSFPGEKATIGENYYATLIVTPHYKTNLWIKHLNFEFRERERERETERERERACI